MFVIVRSDGTPKTDLLDVWDCIATYEDEEEARLDLVTYWNNEPTAYYTMMYIPKSMFL